MLYELMKGEKSSFAGADSKAQSKGFLKMY